MLDVLGYANTFIVFFFFYSFTFHLNRCGITVHTSLRTACFALYFATCLFTYVRNDREIRWQRIVAIVLNVITILYLGLYTVFAVIYTDSAHCNNQ